MSLYVSPVNAVAATVINFQSKLVVKTSGLNVVAGTPACIAGGADTCDFRFNIYTDAAGGTLLWREPHANLEIGDNAGYFNVELNSVCTSWTSPGGSCSGSGIDWGSDSTVYIEVQIDTDGDGDFASGGADTLETFARKLFASVPYAYYADEAGSLDGIASTGFVQFAPSGAQSTSSTNSLINLATTANTSNTLIIANENGAGTPNLLDIQVGASSRMLLNNAGQLQLAVTGSNGGLLLGGDAQLYRSAADVVRTPDSLIVDVNGSFGTTTSTAFVNAAAATTAKASMRIISSAGTDVSSPNSGDLWWNGTNLNFYNGSGNVDLLAAAGGSFVNFSTGSLQTSTDTDQLINISTTGNVAAGALFNMDENGAGTPNLLNISVASTARLTLNNAGQLQLPTTGNTGGILIGGDAQWYRSAADTLRTPDALIVDGRAAFGLGTIQTDRGIDVDNTYASPGATTSYGIFNETRFQTSASVPQYSLDNIALAEPGGNTFNTQIYGSRNSGRLNSTGTVASLYGMFGEVVLQAAGTITTGAGVVGRVIVNGSSGTIATGSAFRAQNPFQNAGTLTNNYGMYIEDQTAGGTADYGLYIAGADTNAIWVDADDSRFDGNIWLGTTSGGDWLTIAAATTAKSQIQLTTSGGTNVSAPTSGDLWWNGTNLYFFDGSSNVDLLAGGADPTKVDFATGSAQSSASANSLIDVVTTGNVTNAIIKANENGAGTPSLLQLQVAGSDRLLFTNAGQLQLSVQGNTGGVLIGGDTQLYRNAADVIRTPDSIIVDVNGSFGTTTATAFINAAAATTAKASMRFISSAGTNVSSPNSGDLWWNGTNFYFYNGSTNVDLLAASGANKVDFATGSTQTSATTNSLIDVTTTGNVTNPVIRVNENGAGTPNLISLLTAGTTQFAVTNAGNIQSIAGAVWQPTSNTVTALGVANAAGTRFVDFDTSNSRVGIGNNAPATMLDVTGVGRIGNITNTTAGSCTPTIEGAMYYSSDDKVYKYCDGSAWKWLGTSLAATRKTIQTRTVLYENELSSNGNWDVQNIDQTYDDLEINLSLRSSNASTSDIVYMYLNNDLTNTNYRATNFFGADAATSVTEVDLPRISNVITAANSPTNGYGQLKIILNDYTQPKLKTAFSYTSNNNTSTQDTVAASSYTWENTAAVNRIFIDSPTGGVDFVASSTIQIVGIREESVIIDVSGAAGASSSAATNTGNLAMNYPSIELANAAQPEWWEEQDANITLTEDSASTEAVTGKHPRVLKGVTGGAGANKYFYQRYVHADQGVITDSSSVVSAGAWVYNKTAGTVTLTVFDVGGTASLGTASTTTTNAWVFLRVENVTVGTTSTDVRFSHSANSATFYAAMPVFNVGTNLAGWTERPLVFRDKFVSAVVNAVDPAGAGFTDVDLTSNTNGLTAKAELAIRYSDTTTVGQTVAIRRNGSAGANVVLRTTVAAQLQAGYTTTFLDDTQIFEYDTSAAGGDTESLTIDLWGYYEWGLAGGSGGGGGSGSGSSSGSVQLRRTETVIYENTLGANGSWDVQSIPQTYTDLKIIIRARGTVSATTDAVYMTLNNDTTNANYYYETFSGVDATTSVGEAADRRIANGVPAATGPTNSFGEVIVSITNYTNTSMTKTYSATQSFQATTSQSFAGVSMNTWLSTAAINRIAVTTDNPGTDLFVAGSTIKILGYKQEEIIVGGSGGGGISGALYDRHRQDDTTNNEASYQVMRKGWGYVQATSSTFIEDAVNFGITYTDTPIVLLTHHGNAASAPASVSDCSAGIHVNGMAAAITSSGFNARMYINDNDIAVNLGNTYYCYSWIAIGTYGAGYGADLAEYYQSYDMNTEAGDVVAIDTSHDVSVVRSGERYQNTAIGVIATKPGIVLGNADGTTEGVQTAVDGSAIVAGQAKAVQVALAGRVPVKVSLENGPIRKGDPLTTSSIPGVAMKATQTGRVIGHAMEDYDGTSQFVAVNNADQAIDTATLEQQLAQDTFGIGKVMAFVETGYYWAQDNVAVAPLQQALGTDVAEIQVTNENTDSTATQTLEVSTTPYVNYVASTGTTLLSAALDTGNIGIGAVPRSDAKLTVGGDIVLGTAQTQGCIRSGLGELIAGACAYQKVDTQLVEEDILERLAEISTLTGQGGSYALDADSVFGSFPELVYTEGTVRKVNYGASLQSLTIAGLIQQHKQVQKLSTDVDQLKQTYDARLSSIDTDMMTLKQFQEQMMSGAGLLKLAGITVASLEVEKQLTVGEDLAGELRFRPGETEVTVKFSQPFPGKPLLFFSSIGTMPQMELKEVTNSQFTVRLLTPSESMISVNWLVVWQKRNAQDTEATYSTSNPQPVESEVPVEQVAEEVTPAAN